MESSALELLCRVFDTELKEKFCLAVSGCGSLRALVQYSSCGPLLMQSTFIFSSCKLHGSSVSLQEEGRLAADVIYSVVHLSVGLANALRKPCRSAERCVC